MNTEAMRGVADLVEHHDRFSLLFFAAFTDILGSQMYVNRRRVPTAEQLIEGHIRARSESGAYVVRTVGCIAGWTNAWDGHHDLEDWRHAADVLDLDVIHARRLFFAQTDASIWRRAGRLAGWRGKDYRTIRSGHATTMLRGLADGSIRMTR